MKGLLLILSLLSIVNLSKPTTTTPAITPAPAYAPFTITCPANHECLRIPSGCHQNGKCNCDAIVLVSKSSSDGGSSAEFFFEILRSRTDASYVAVGLSKDAFMNDDFVVMCSENVITLWNEATTTAPYKTTVHFNTSTSVSEKTVSEVDGIVRCTFKLKQPFSGPNNNLFSVNFPLFLFLASGRVNDTDPTLPTYHARQRSDTSFTLWNSPNTTAGYPAVPVAACTGDTDEDVDGSGGKNLNRGKTSTTKNDANLFYKKHTWEFGTISSLVTVIWFIEGNHICF